MTSSTSANKSVSRVSLAMNHSRPNATRQRVSLSLLFREGLGRVTFTGILILLLRVMTMQSKEFTPKGLHPIAQGCRASGYPGYDAPPDGYPEGVTSYLSSQLMEPLR